MTDLMSEVTALEGIDLADAPPCDVIVNWWLFGRRRRCARPSTHRVRVTCPEHGTRLRFICRRHLPFVKRDWAMCGTCDFRTPLRFGGYT